MTKNKDKRRLSGIRGALASVAELVTKNFWLKVLSLAIATVVYVVLRPEAEEKPILPYVTMNAENERSEPAHSVVIESEAAQPKADETPQPKTTEAPQPKTDEAPKPPAAATNNLHSAESEPKGNSNENDGKRQ